MLSVFLGGGQSEDRVSCLISSVYTLCIGSYANVNYGWYYLIFQESEDDSERLPEATLMVRLSSV